MRWRKEFRRGFEAIQFQFPELLLFSARSWPERGILAVAFVVVLAAVATLLSVGDGELLKILVSAPLGLLTAVGVFLLFRGFRIYWQTRERDQGALRSIALKEEIDFQGGGPRVPHFALPVGAASMQVVYEPEAYHIRPPVVADMLRWHEEELEAAFVMGRGALDRPKVSLAELTLAGEKPLLQLGGCSYYDKFCLHDSAHRELSRVPIQTATGQSPTTPYNVLGPPAGRWLERLGKQPRSVKPPPFLPNGLGFSGLLRVREPNRTVWLIQRRGGPERADVDLLDCTFAGMIEVEKFLDGSAPSLEEVFLWEFDDETPIRLQELAARCDMTTEPLFLLFEPDRLYQPELLALCTIDSAEPVDFKELLASSRPGKTSFAIEEAHLLASIKTAVDGGQIALAGRPRRYHVKDNLVSALSFLVAEGILAPLRGERGETAEHASL